MVAIRVASIMLMQVQKVHSHNASKRKGSHRSLPFAVGSRSMLEGATKGVNQKQNRVLI